MDKSADTKNPQPSTSSTSTSTIHHNNNNNDDNLNYLHGLDNHYESEAIPNTLPQHRNNPKVGPQNLYTEQLSGTAFTTSRHLNKRTWLYRTQPSVCHVAFSLFQRCGEGEGGGGGGGLGTGKKYPEYFGHLNWDQDLILDPNPMRWLPSPFPSSSSTITNDEKDNVEKKKEKKKAVDFIQGTKTMMGSGEPTTKNGMAIHMYTINSNMRRGEDDDDDDGENVHMYNSDGDFLIVPQHGSLDIQTEMGRMIVHPKEICVLPRGIVFSVNVYKDPSENVNNNDEGGNARGYILEVFSGHFHLPELGPIGSNGLANARDFLIPTASFDKTTTTTTTSTKNHHSIVNKFGNTLFVQGTPHSPYNVVAWHGNYVPFKYNLEHFCAINSVTYDHPDPSIYTVLTVPNASSPEIGTALADFVIFPPRIMATDDDTFRPPWYHRNCMSEFMGLIHGQYDAKKEGFVPGGCSLHNCMTPHGPDSNTFHKAVNADCSKPAKFDGGLAFMFETSCMLKVSKYALSCKEVDSDYAKCWDGLNNYFSDE